MMFQSLKGRGRSRSQRVARRWKKLPREILLRGMEMIKVTLRNRLQMRRTKLNKQALGRMKVLPLLKLPVKFLLERSPRVLKRGRSLRSRKSWVLVVKVTTKEIVEILHVLADQIKVRRGLSFDQSNG